MKKFLFLVPMLLLLTGCLSEEEIRSATEDLKAKRAETIKVIEAKDYSLNGLLKTHDYFFAFAEKVDLMLEEEKAKKAIQALVKELGVKGFCESFIVPNSTWRILENHCSGGSFYKCSPEIKEYKSILAKFKEIAGPELNLKFQAEVSCD